MADEGLIKLKEYFLLHQRQKMKTDYYLMGWQLKDGNKKYIKELSICKDPIWHGPLEFTLIPLLTIHFNFVDGIKCALALSEKNIVACIPHLVQQMIEERNNNASHIFICDTEGNNYYKIQDKKLQRISPA